jgi:hypothetical protein
VLRKAVPWLAKLVPVLTLRGRVLKGVIVSPEPIVMLGAMVLVEDERGDLARVRVVTAGARQCD